MNTLMQGFFFTHNNKGFFYQTDKVNKTDKIANTIIDAVGRTFNKPAEWTEQAKANKEAVQEVKRLTDSVTVLCRATDEGIDHYSILAKNYCLNFPADEYKKFIVEV